MLRVGTAGRSLLENKPWPTFPVPHLVEVAAEFLEPSLSLTSEMCVALGRDFLYLFPFLPRQAYTVPPHEAWYKWSDDDYFMSFITYYLFHQQPHLTALLDSLVEV